MNHRLSSADTAWLHMDRPTNLMVINSVLLFDEPVEWPRVKQVVQLRLVERFSRFRQRVVESRLPLRAPEWQDDPDFALEHHMHHLALPAPGDTAALQELVGDLMTMPLDRNRPLWQIYMIDGVGDGAAMLIRMHHCIADGIALARVMLSLTDDSADTGIAPPDDLESAARRGRTDRFTGPARQVLRRVERTTRDAVGQAADIATSPSHAIMLAGAVRRDAGTALRLLFTESDATSPLKGDPGISRCVAWTSPLSLARVKRIAVDHDATVNDVLLAAVSASLRHYLNDRGSRPREIQAMVPFNLRPLDEPLPRELGNRFGLVFLPLPVGVSGSLGRLVEVRRRMDRIKRGRDAPISYALLSLSGLAPEAVERRIVDMFSAKATAVMTNVPGPREPVYLAGAPVRTVLVWAPTSGHIGMSVSIFSYRGEVTVGLMVDSRLVPEPESLIIGLEQELDVLSRIGFKARSRRHVRRGASDGDRTHAGARQRPPTKERQESR